MWLYLRNINMNPYPPLGFIISSNLIELKKQHHFNYKLDAYIFIFLKTEPTAALSIHPLKHGWEFHYGHIVNPPPLRSRNFVHPKKHTHNFHFMKIYGSRRFLPGFNAIRRRMF